jgi:hypothetical protein
MEPHPCFAERRNADSIIVGEGKKRFYRQGRLPSFILLTEHWQQIADHFFMG